MARIVIAGASGLTGLALTRLLAGSHEVIAVARRPAPDGLPHSVTWVSADVSQVGWTSALPAQYDAVYALFQSPDFRAFPEKASAVFTTNVSGLQELLSHAHSAGANRFVFTSTGGLYAASEGPIAEDASLTTAGPLGFYLTTKRCGELLVESYSGLMSTLIVRPFFIYGPNQSASMLIPRLVQSIKEGKALALQGDNGLSINPIYVDDAAFLLSRALDTSKNGVVNLAGPESVSLREIGNLIGTMIGVEPVFTRTPDTKAPAVISDNARLEILLGKPQTRVDTGLRSVCNTAS
jgi:UDP-glucose 4-epimerase